MARIRFDFRSCWEKKALSRTAQRSRLGNLDVTRLGKSNRKGACLVVPLCFPWSALEHWSGALSLSWPLFCCLIADSRCSLILLMTCRRPSASFTETQSKKTAPITSRSQIRSLCRPRCIRGDACASRCKHASHRVKTHRYCRTARLQSARR